MVPAGSIVISDGRSMKFVGGASVGYWNGVGVGLGFAFVHTFFFVLCPLCFRTTVLQWVFALAETCSTLIGMSVATMIRRVRRRMTVTPFASRGRLRVARQRGRPLRDAGCRRRSSRAAGGRAAVRPCAALPDGDGLCSWPVPCAPPPWHSPAALPEGGAECATGSH